MTPGKFDWFLHTMLFLQTQYVLDKEKEMTVDELEVEDDRGRDDVGYDGGDV